MKKWLLFLFILIVLIEPVLAYQGPFSPNETVSLYSSCVISQNGEKTYLNSTQNLTIRYENGSIYKENILMIPYAEGRFSADVIFNFTGSFLLEKYCSGFNGKVAVGSDIAEVIDINEEVEKLALFGLLVFFAVGIAFMVLGYTFHSGFLHLFAGVWFFGGGFVYADQIIPVGSPFVRLSTGWIVLSLLLLYCLFEGYTALEEEKKKYSRS